MIKAKINATGEVVEVRPYQTEIYDFMVCRNGGIMGELYMRSELTIIGDNEFEFVSLVRRMREAQKDCMAWDNAMASGYELTEEEWEDYGRSQAVRELFEKEVDEYLKED